MQTEDVFFDLGDNTSICRTLHILRKPNSIRDWSKSMGGGDGPEQRGVGHEVLSLVQGVGHPILLHR